MGDYHSIHTGQIIDATISATIAGKAGIQGVSVNDTEITPDPSSNKVNINLPIVSQTTGQSTTQIMSQKAITDSLSQKADSSSLSSVATSGSYNDLSNAVNDDNASYGALEAQAQQAADNVIYNETTAASAPKYIQKDTDEIIELDGIKLAVDKSLKNSKFSYELNDNKLVITAKKCTVNIIDVTNNDIEVELNGSNITLNSDKKVKSILSNASNSIINGSAEDDNITVTGMNTTVNALDGNDTITSNAMDTTINGGAGNDTINASGINVKVYGNSGEDNISVSGVNTYVDDENNVQETQTKIVRIIRTLEASGEIIIDRGGAGDELIE